MSLSTKALVVSVLGAIVFPVLLVAEMLAFMMAGMLAYEPSNPWFIKVAAAIVVALVGAASLLLPAVGFVMGTRARRLIGSSDAFVAGAGVALTAQVIAGIAMAGVVLMQVFLVLWAAGVCSLDGC